MKLESAGMALTAVGSSIMSAAGATAQLGESAASFAMMGVVVVVTYFGAFLIGAAALWKVRDDSYVYAVTFASTTASLAFCFKYAGYVSSAEYTYVHGALTWAGLHILHGLILCGFHVARFRGEI